MVACRLEFRLPGGGHVVPRRIPRPDEPLADYLLDRRSLFRDEGTVITSMLLAPRRLLLEVPFATGLSRHQDADWLLRAAARGARLVFADQVLGVFHGEEERQRVSVTTEWRPSLDWIRDRAALVTPRAYAGFVLSQVSSAAAPGRDPRVFVALLREAFAAGRPRARHVALHCAMWALPRRLRSWSRRRWLG
jgi:hypothetical protein